MFNYGTLQSMVEALLEHNKKVLEFEKGMEKLLGPDSTVMSTWMSDAPYEMLKTLIMAEGGETEDGWNWFEEHLDDFMKGTGSKIAIKEELALMEAGFSGAITDDLENGTVYIEAEKNDLVSSFQEDLVNEMQGYGMDDSTSWTILYKDGSKKYLSHDMENDFDDTHITKGMYKQAYTNAKNALKLSNVAAIIKSDGYEQPRYYVAKGGEKQMRDYGFEFWKKGRGEKKRNYIQDDWV